MRGGGDAGDSARSGLLHQGLPEIQVPRAGSLDRSSAAGHDFSTYFIAGTAYTNATMH